MKGIAFEGSGMGVFCHLGLIKYLQENKSELLKSFEWFSGTSSGSAAAVVTALCSAGVELDYIEKAKTIQPPAINFVKGLYNFKKKFGYYSTDFMYNFIKEVIGAVTFEEFAAKYKKQLVITAVDLKFNVHYFAAATTPTLEVAEAVARSCSYPVVFHHRSGFIDGGVRVNFPFKYLVDKLGQENVYGSYIVDTAPAEATDLTLFFIGLLNCITTDKTEDILAKEDQKNIIKIKTATKTFDFGNFEGIAEGFAAGYDFFN
jgi:predicted acylesterase/phospholipase RssA